MFIPDLPPISRKCLQAVLRGKAGQGLRVLEAPPMRLLFHSGRAAFRWGLDRLIGAGALRVLVPAYFCESVMPTLRQSGLPVAFYDIDAGLNPLPLLNDIRSGDAVVVVHYFGRPVDLSPIVEACRRQDCFLVEDCAHANPFYDSAEIGRAGDMSIYSLRKQLPVPDGGLLSINPTGRITLEKVPEPLKIRAASWKKLVLGMSEAVAFRYGINLYSIKSELRRRFGSTDSGFQRGAIQSGRQTSGCTLAMAADFNWKRACDGRRGNYSQLADRLRNAGRIFVPFPDLPDRAIPQVLPVLTERADDAVERLQRKGIGASRWPGAQSVKDLDYRRYPVSRKWMKYNLLLPIHENIRSETLCRISDLLTQYAK